MKTSKLSRKSLIPRFNFDIRDAVSYQIDYFFGDKKFDDYVIDYDIFLSNGKPLQRDYVWTLEQKRSFILSLLKEINIPNMLVLLYNDDINKKSERIFKIVDGKQRISTIRDFFNGCFGILFDDKEYFYNDLDDDTKMFLRTRDLRFNIVYEYPDTLLSDSDLVNMFEFVNFAGTPQDINHLVNLKNSL